MRKSFLFGLFGSAMIHAIILLVSALWGWGGYGDGNANAYEGVEVVLLPEVDLQSGTQATLDIGGAPEVEPPELTLEDLPIDVGEISAAELDSIGDVESIAESQSGAGDGAPGEMGAGGSGGGTSFFGVEAEGSRFAYIVDTSGSMVGGKLERLKRELIGSLGELLEHMSFYVVFYASESMPIGGRTKWIDATETAQKWAAARILEVAAVGATHPAPAFEIVLDLRPRPDAIYFMTDGRFDEADADMIKIRNAEGRRVPIHCITFGDRAAEALMRRIARESGGSYTHIEVSQ